MATRTRLDLAYRVLEHLTLKCVTDDYCEGYPPSLTRTEAAGRVLAYLQRRTPTDQTYSAESDITHTEVASRVLERLSLRVPSSNSEGAGTTDNATIAGLALEYLSVKEAGETAESEDTAIVTARLASIIEGLARTGMKSWSSSIPDYAEVPLARIAAAESAPSFVPAGEVAQFQQMAQQAYNQLRILAFGTSAVTPWVEAVTVALQREGIAWWDDTDSVPESAVVAVSQMVAAELAGAVLQGEATIAAIGQGQRAREDLKRLSARAETLTDYVRDAQEEMKRYGMMWWLEETKIPQSIIGPFTRYVAACAAPSFVSGEMAAAYAGQKDTAWLELKRSAARPQALIPHIDEIFEELAESGVTYWSDDLIPLAVMRPLTRYVAGELAPAFSGLVNPMPYQAEQESAMQDLLALTRSPEPARTAVDSGLRCMPSLRRYRH